MPSPHTGDIMLGDSKTLSQLSSYTRNNSAVGGPAIGIGYSSINVQQGEFILWAAINRFYNVESSYPVNFNFVFTPLSTTSGTLETEPNNSYAEATTNLYSQGSRGTLGYFYNAFDSIDTYAFTASNAWTSLAFAYSGYNGSGTEIQARILNSSGSDITVLNGNSVTFLFDSIIVSPKANFSSSSNIFVEYPAGKYYLELKRKMPVTYKSPIAYSLNKLSLYNQNKSSAIVSYDSQSQLISFNGSRYTNNSNSILALETYSLKGKYISSITLQPRESQDIPSGASPQFTIVKRLDGSRLTNVK